jgi:hypothetical protein
MSSDQPPARPGDPDDTPLGRALSAYLAGDRTAAEHLSADQHGLVLEVGPLLAALQPPAPVAETSTGTVIPSLAEDPIAMALGLVVDPDRLLAARSLNIARRQRGLKVSELASSLAARGWEVKTADVAAWERADSPQLSALVAAIADVLHTTPTKLVLTSPPPRAGPREHPLDDGAIAARLAAWADEAGVPVADVRHKVNNALAGAFHRNARQPTATALLQIIEILSRIKGFLDGP